MKTDKELLELAALAFWGDEIDDVVSIRWGEQDNAILYTHADNQDHNGQDREFVWNPIEQDHDALRLAVKLRIKSERHINQPYVAAWAPNIASRFEEPEGSNPYAATRRAIVRAAAAIGEAK